MLAQCWPNIVGSTTNSQNIVILAYDGPLLAQYCVLNNQFTKPQIKSSYVGPMLAQRFLANANRTTKTQRWPNAVLLSGILSAFPRLSPNLSIQAVGREFNERDTFFFKKNLL
jgi:hypothetical protein